MSLPIPFRRKRTKADQAYDLAQSALKFWASTRVAKSAAKKGAKLPLIGAGLVAAGVAAKKLTGRKDDEPAAYTPPAPYTPPQPEKLERTPPHGDPATDLPKPGGESAAQPQAGDPSEAAGKADASS